MKTREQNKTKKTIGNRAIWLIYRTNINTCWFWLIKRTLGWKNFVREKFLEINRYFSLTSYCNAIGRSNHDFSPCKGFLWRENEESMFWSFHPLVDKTNNEHLRKPLFQGDTKIVLSISGLHDGFFISLSAVLFTLFGFYQMAVWAIGKHRNYRKEFKDYRKGRKAIVPFLL